jgi:hypothetical protein
LQPTLNQSYVADYHIRRLVLRARVLGSMVMVVLKNCIVIKTFVV